MPSDVLGEAALARARAGDEDAGNEPKGKGESDGHGDRGCASDVAQQFLRAGLLDEIQVSVAPVVLGGGVALFDELKPGPVRLAQIRAIESDGVTHLRYRVVK